MIDKEFARIIEFYFTKGAEELKGSLTKSEKVISINAKVKSGTPSISFMRTTTYKL